MLVVLNHIDTVPADRRESMLADLRRLLDADGLDGVPVIATSAPGTARGWPSWAAEIAERVPTRRRQARLRPTSRRPPSGSREANGTRPPGDVARGRADGARRRASRTPPAYHGRGAVEDSTQACARTAPPGGPSPPGSPGSGPTRSSGCTSTSAPAARSYRAARASVPEADQGPAGPGGHRGPVARRRRGAEAPPAWAAAVRRASVSRLPDLNDALDRAVGGTDLGVSRTPVWWRLVRVLQWVLVLAALAGGLWLAGLAFMGYLQMPQPSTPKYAGFPVPTLLLLGGAVLGVLLGLVCSWPCGCPRAAGPAPPTGGCGRDP